MKTAEETRKRLYENTKKWRLKNADRWQAVQKSWEKKNREKRNAQQRARADKRRVTSTLWRQRNPERYRGYFIKRKYGITLEQYQELLNACDNKCVVCRVEFDAKIRSRRPNIDHCHNTGVVRGVICQGCNLAEGQLKNPESALRLYKYMLSNELLYQKTN